MKNLESKTWKSVVFSSFIVGIFVSVVSGYKPGREVEIQEQETPLFRNETQSYSNWSDAKYGSCSKTENSFSAVVFRNKLNQTLRMIELDFKTGEMKLRSCSPY